MKLYDNFYSGHAHHPRALLKLLGLSYETIIIDLAKGEQRSDEFLRLNPLGEVPVLVDGEIVLRESTAILTYLAAKYDDTGQWLPLDPLPLAQVQSWLSISTKEVYLGPCSARLIKLFGFDLDYTAALAQTTSLLRDVFEPHLTKQDWLVAKHPTLADVANYGYIASAHEGEIDLGPYANVRSWLKRLEALKGFEPMSNSMRLTGKDRPE